MQTTNTITAVDLQFYQVTLDELAISPLEVMEQAKMDAGMPEYETFIENELLRFRPIQSIKGGIAIIDKVAVQKGRISLNGVEFEVGRQIAYELKGATKAALFIFTAGQEVSDRSRELMERGELLEGFLVDVLGTVIVEKAIDSVHQRLMEEFKETGLNCTNRYSPGYCDWSVQDQPQLFSFFPDGYCDITLSDSCLMYPIKSVSGIIGIGEQVKFQPYRCEICRSKTCIYRKVKADQTSL